MTQKQTEQSELIEIRARVNKLFYSSNDFSAGTFENLEKTDELGLPALSSFSGKLRLKAGQNYIFVGRWVDNKKYGEQFEVSTIKVDTKLDREGLITYLQNNPVFVGIGPKRAAAIVARFGDCFEETLLERPDEIAAVAGIKPEAIANIREEWEKNKAINSVSVWLASYGLTQNQITKITDKYGANAKNLLTEDPYLIISEIPGFGFARVDDIALKMGTKKADPHRIRNGILWAIDEQLGEGHCWTERPQLIELVNRLLCMDVMRSKELITKELDDMLTFPDTNMIVATNVNNHQIIGHHKTAYTETNILDHLNKRKKTINPFISKDTEYPETYNLNDNQKECVKKFLESGISLITGGAGTGKTYVVSAIIDICKQHEIEFYLAAPTGKAAKRINEVTGEAASTMHILLSAYDGIFGRNKYDQLPEAVYIIDEVSMVDIFLFSAFLDAVPTNSAIVLVGDHNQLPPVGAGNVIRDIIQNDFIPITLLEKTVRQAGALKHNSIAILNGVVAKTEYSDNISPWYLINQPDKTIIPQQIENIIFDGLKCYHPLEVQVLTSIHKGEIGTKEINAYLQRAFQRRMYGNILPEDNNGKVFYINDKVIQTRNDYETGVMNGETGIVLYIDDENYYVHFTDKQVKIPKSGNALQLAYCLTVHKSQGSEYQAVITIVHKSHSFNHHRNWLYTAVTRAKKSSIIIGDVWGIKNCAAKQQVIKRRTWLSIYMLYLKQTANA